MKEIVESDSAAITLTAYALQISMEEFDTPEKCLEAVKQNNHTLSYVKDKSMIPELIECLKMDK